MGQTFLVVNHSKQQYMDPGAFGENSKRSGLFTGLHVSALALLVVDARSAFDHLLIGSWSGDSISAVGDYADAWLQVKADFEDLSSQAIAMLCEINDNYAHELARRASTDDALFVNLATIVHTLGVSQLERSIQEAFGPSWKARYRDLYPKWS
jgi:hypothetical protein